MYRYSRLATKALNYLVVIAILLTSVPMPMSAAARAARPASAGESAAESPTVDEVAVESPVTLPLGSQASPVLGATARSSTALPTFQSPLSIPEPESAEPGVRLYAITNPPVLELGARAVCTVTVVNEDVADLAGLTLSAPLPTGLIVADDPSARQWQATVGDLAMGETRAVTLSLRLDGRAWEPFEFEIALRDGDDNLRATTTAIVGVDRPGVGPLITPAGGSFAAGNGRVRADFPPGALGTSVQVSARVHAQRMVFDRQRGAGQRNPFSWDGTLMHFSIEAQDEQTGEEIDTFAQPVTLTVDLRGLVGEEGLPLGWRPFLCYETDPETGECARVPATFDPQTGLLAAQVDHFSDWTGGATGEGWEPMFTPAMPDLFSGAMTYNYSIQVPPGRNGLQPQVSLGYSSRGIDGLIKGNEKDGGPIGLGWSVGGTIDVMRKVNYSWDGAHYRLSMKEKFWLLLNGTSHELEPDNASLYCGRYRARNAPGLYVERRNSGCGNGSPSNETTDYWIVRQPDGTELRLGYTDNSEVRMDQRYNLLVCDGFCAPGDDNDSLGANRWRVDTVTDPMGNKMAFTYEEDATYQSSLLSTYQTSRIKEIYYNNYDDGGIERWLSKVEFVQASDPMRIARINVWHIGAKQRYYELTTNYQARSAHGHTTGEWAVTKIQEFSGAGSTSLPATTFEHVLKMNGPYNGFRFRRIDAVENGYGGRTEFYYVGDERWIGDDYHLPEYGYSYWVSEMHTYDGINANPSRVTYQYGTRCYQSSPPAGTKVCGGRHPKYSLVGHAWTQETALDWNGTTPLVKTKHHYYADDAVYERWQQGREYRIQVYSGQDELLRQTDTDWDSVAIGGTDFAHVIEVETTDYSGGADITTRVTYDDYDSYGNLTSRTEYDESDAKYRQTKWGYYPNTTAHGIWIVNKPGFENVYSWTGTWSLEASTWYAYDGNPRFDGQIGDNATDKGLLSAVRAWRGSEVPASEQMIDVRYGYDGWGNRTSETTYDGYGDYDTFASAGPHVTTIVYDTAYELYSVQTYNALNQYATTEYYGVGGVAADHGLPGQVKRVIDPNGAATEYQYDDLGRLTGVWRPGEDLDDPPSRLISYYDVTHPDWLPLMIVTYEKTDSNVSWSDFWTGVGNVWTRQFYDGLGRPIQTQTRADDWTPGGGSGEHEVLQYTVYDALGRASQQSVPYEVARYVYNPSDPQSPYRTPDSGQPCTITKYDALGQAVRVVNPDGTVGSTMYAGLYTSQVDANGHYKFAVSDAFGRLARVDETVTTLEDPFSGLNSSTWTFSGHQSIDGGTLKNTGTGSNYNANFYRTSYSLSAEEGIKVEFKVSQGDTGAHFSLETSDGGVYRRWGVVANSNKIYAQFNNGSGWQYPKDLINPVQVGKWYVLTLKVGENGWFYTELWQKDNPAVRGTYMGQMASGKNWRFHHWTYRGTTWLDNYHELDYQTTDYAYDVMDNLTQVTDAAGNITTMIYDPLSRKEEMDDPDMGYWYYQYDAAGNLKRQTDARDCIINFAYDQLNRLTGKTYSGGCSGTAVSYTYDSTASGNKGIGRRTGMSDASGSTSWTYDERGRVKAESKTINGAGTFVTEYTYNTADQVLTMKYPDGEIVTNSYSHRGLLESLTGDTPYVENVEYNEMGQKTLIEFGSNLQTSYIYYPWTTTNGLGRLQYLRTGTSSSPASLQNLTYTYDAVGNVQSITDGKNSNQVQNFTYDALDRLTDAETTSSGQGQYNREYDYNSIGNLTYRSDLGTYAYPASGPSSVRPHAVTSVGGNSYNYDDNGNMTSRTENGSIYTQDFNAENKLESVTVDGETTTFIYDGDGNRVKRVESDGDTVVYVGGYYEVSYPTPTGSEIKLVTGKLTGVGSSWQTVVLPYTYDSMVVVAAPNYDSGDKPAVVRIRNASGNSFQIRVQNPSDQSLSGYTVHYLAVEEGVYTQAQHGVKMEAKKYTSTRTDENNSWVGQSRSYQQSYSSPVVLGQVMTANDADWSVFWARGSSRTEPPSGSYLYTGKNVSEDSDTTRANETIGYVVIEAGSGSIGGVDYVAGLGADTVRGVDNAPPYNYAISGPSSAGVAVVSTAAMDGGNGGWPLLYGSDPVNSSQLKLAFDEDQIGDSERAHTTEQVAYVVFAGEGMEATKYYYAAGQRVAMNRDGVVQYLHGDHLGSTSLATTASGAEVTGSRTLYYPYGEERWSASGGTLATDYGFTGQRREDFGLMDYNARYYDPYLARFISADTIIPDLANPQAFNRYSYCLGNPVKYTDPSGHAADSYGNSWSVVDCPTCEPVSPEKVAETVTFMAVGVPTAVYGAPVLGDIAGAGAAGVKALYWKAGEWYLRGKLAAQTGLLALLNKVVGRELADGDDDEVRLLEAGQEAIGPHSEMRGPAGDGLDSHHIIQDAWAQRQNIPGYSREAAPAIRLPPAPDHRAANAVQRMFRQQYGWDTTFEQEIQLAQEALQAAGVSSTAVNQAIESARQYFTGLQTN